MKTELVIKWTDKKGDVINYTKHLIPPLIVNTSTTLNIRSQVTFSMGQ